ncbi:MAG: methionyl-tRNA formyltransferase [Actinobacteria bacterium]|nr:methionyl-tRNA formyltransferase [Actinomycetota bacterium]
MRLVFAGTPTPAAVSLRALLASDRHEVVGVVTRPPAPAGRGRRASVSPVEALARDAGISVLTPARPSDPAFQAELASIAPDCCPVVAYGAIVPTSALAIPRLGWVNLHFSLLPAWRGAAPVQHAILAGDQITGASTFQLEAGLDTGPVYGVVTEAIRPNDTAGELLGRLTDSGADLLLATMDGIEDGSLIARPQPGDGVSIATKITVADVRVDWSAPALHIDRLVRAATPEPGPWTEFGGLRLKLGPLEFAAVDDHLAPGELLVGRRDVLVGTGTAALRLGTVQAPGRRPVPAADWARGAHPRAGDRFA